MLTFTVMGRKVIMKVTRSKKKKSYELQRRQPDYDYLKNFKVVQYWATRKYDLSNQDLYILFYLYSERLFSKTDFLDHCKIHSWNKDRFDDLLKFGWISSWRNGTGGLHALYEISQKGRKMVNEFYKKLEGKSHFPENTQNNPTFKRKTFTDKVMANEMMAINKKIKARNSSFKRR